MAFIRKLPFPSVSRFPLRSPLIAAALAAGAVIGAFPASAQPVPPVDEVRDQIRGVLREKRLNEALDKWTQELRQRADVQVYFDQPAGKLPPWSM